MAIAKKIHSFELLIIRLIVPTNNLLEQKWERVCLMMSFSHKLQGNCIEPFVTR